MDTDNSNASWGAQDKSFYLQTFNRFPVAFERGEGCYLWDVEGKKYIDALAGIAVNSVGHSHPKVVKAMQDQAAKLVHVSNFFVTKPQVDLAEKLVSISNMDRVFFANSGAESVEGAIKLARKYAHTHGRGGNIISFEGSFHGRTLATIATGKPAMQKGFEPIPAGFMKAKFNDLESVKALVDQGTAAIIVEPIQGEGGINIATPEFLQGLRTLCDEHNIVLIFDEIQCGMGRTGHWFAKDYFGVQPDIMTLAKALGGGVPIGAFLSVEKIASAIAFGDHGTTFGGNPFVCAAALAVIEVIEEENLLQAATETGQWLKETVKSMNPDAVKDVRGVGLMFGIEFDFTTRPLVLDMLKNGVIANATADKVLRLVPPLTISKDQLQTVLEVMEASMKNIQTHA